MASLEAMVADAEEDTGFDFAEFFLRDDKTPRTEHLRNLFWEQLHAALAELPEEQRQVFVWHELEAMSFQDISALTGENVNTLLLTQTLRNSSPPSTARTAASRTFSTTS